MDSIWLKKTLEDAAGKAAKAARAAGDHVMEHKKLVGGGVVGGGALVVGGPEWLASGMRRGFGLGRRLSDYERATERQEQLEEQIEEHPEYLSAREY